MQLRHVAHCFLSHSNECRKRRDQGLTSTTLLPGCTAPVCISILSVEYSVSYDSEMVSPAGQQGCHTKHQYATLTTAPVLLLLRVSPAA